MPEISSSELIELRRISSKLLDLVDKLEGVPIEVPDEVRKEVERKLKARICLACGAVIPAGIKVKRGQEDACYSTTRARIRRGDVRERDLVLTGKLTAEPAQPGRPAKQDLTAEQLRVVAEDVERYEKSSDGDG